MTTLADFDALEGDTLVLFVAADERPLLGVAGLADWRLCGRLSRYLVREWFTGAEGEKVLAPGGALGAERILGIGVGEGTRLDAERLTRAAEVAGAALAEARVDDAVIGLPGAGAIEREAAERAVRAGIGRSFSGRVTVLG